MDKKNIILLVEDDAFLRKMYSTKLEKEGFDVFSAENGQEGLDILKTIVPKVALVDIMMPKMDGFEFIKKIKSDGISPDTVVIVLTNLNSSEDIKKAMELGVSDYIVKVNYLPSEVVEKIKKYIK
jgi:DNA-binding response OmpR family regulator